MPAFHPRILEQRKRNVAVKRRIAKRAAALVGDGDSVMIVAGSTASFVGQYLLGKTDVKVVTNSTLLLPYARTNPALQMTLTGGVFVPSAEAMVGPNTLRTLGQFHAKTAFLGTDGFSLKSGITADAVDVAEVVRAMAAQADRAVLLADSSKYGRAGFAHIMGLAEIGVLITDNGLEHSIRRDLEEHGIEVECV